MVETSENFEQFQKTLESKGLTVKEWNNRVLVTYPNQGDRDTVDFNDPVCRESKGVVLSKDPLKVICYAMNKFEDLTDELRNELSVSSVWDHVSVENSIDGSLIKLYYYDGEWRFSTNRCIESRKACKEE